VRPHLLPILYFLFSQSAAASPPSSHEAELFDGLLGWAVQLSGYQKPTAHPTVEFVRKHSSTPTRAGANDAACGAGTRIPAETSSVHEAARALIEDSSDPKSLLAASIVVHEFTHYLQAANRNFAKYGCAQALALEHEAYNVQNAYVVAYGGYMQIGISMQNSGCDGSASELDSHAGTDTQ